LRSAFAAMPEFSAAAIEATLKSVAKEQLKIKPGLLIHPTRLALTGSGAGPSLWHLIEILGKERVLKRLDAVLAP
jgi:glutamyl-tRNA synthetase